MKMKGAKNGGITLAEKVLEDEISTDDVGRALSLMARWAVRIAQKKAIINHGTSGKVITLDIANAYKRKTGDK